MIGSQQYDSFEQCGVKAVMSRHVVRIRTRRTTGTRTVAAVLSLAHVTLVYLVERSQLHMHQASQRTHTEDLQTTRENCTAIPNIKRATSLRLALGMISTVLFALLVCSTLC